ncbi:LysR substrate-binding domain-containing protein [Halobacteriovorax sp. HFRX-2_2]|uniref:LysR family transcriptional regulator n=1 Tax=unclassified Halobacteriovorax TaxID=2639665 RepID=UPI003713301B
MNKDQFDGLIALKVVAEKRSFSAAAEELQVSPPAISKMISSLEEKMGVTLLTRTTRSVSLSQAGRIFLDQAGPAMEQIITAQENAKSFGKSTTGTLKLNMPGVFYPYYISKHIRSFLKKYPDVTIDIFSDDQATDIFDEGFDAGIRIDDILAKDLIALKLFGPVEFVAVASPKYLKENGTPKHPKDLLEHNCVRHRFGSGNNIYERWEFEEKKKEFSVKINGNIILNNSENIREAALSDVGIIYTERGNVQDYIDKGKLVLLLEKYIATSSGYYLYYPHRKHMSPTLRAFIDHMKELKSKK